MGDYYGNLGDNSGSDSTERSEWMIHDSETGSSDYKPRAAAGGDLGKRRWRWTRAQRIYMII